MTLEELKIEAEKLGYKLTKKIKYEKLEPCICGWKRIIRGISYPHGSFYYCYKCGLKGETANTQYQARINWNKKVKQND